MAALGTRKSPFVGQQFHIATWNLQGKLNYPDSAQLLMKDLTLKGVDIACLQETRHGPQQFQLKDNICGEIACVPHDLTLPATKRYGQAFFVSRKWARNVQSIKRISNRISVITIFLKKTKKKKILMSIINVYAPTSEISKKRPEETAQFYEQLQQTINCYKSRDMLFVAGDFNAKVGLKHSNVEVFMGAFGKGTRNGNGDQLADFAMRNGLFLSNTQCQHSMRHRSTWRGNIKGQQIYNQIDYIALPLRHRHMIRDSRSYNGHEYESDHSIVITKLQMEKFYLKPQKNKKPRPKYYVNALVETLDVKNRFKTGQISVR